MRIYCPVILMSLFLIMNGHVFQLANEHKGIGVRPASANSVSNQHWQICVKPISRQLRQQCLGEEAR